ncbi:MAG: FAD-dependent oxidoreductase [Pseudomonadota bacterium]
MSTVTETTATEAREPTAAPVARAHPDVLIIGGGGAGLWLLNVLRRRGYSARLLEAKELGGAQTLASQGMIHGGIKYALGGRLTAESEAIARMPERWRHCLEGGGDIDLSGVHTVASEYHMWATGALGTLGSFFASRALRGRIDKLDSDAYPSVFRHPKFDGVVYRLDDLVLDVNTLLDALAAPHRDAIVSGEAVGLSMRGGEITGVSTRAGERLSAGHYLFAAGSGNALFADALRAAGHSQSPPTQLRPLHQVFVRRAGLPRLFAHCLTGLRGAEPRLTITSHPLEPGQPAGGEVGWYIGGQLATTGVQRSLADQQAVARRELSATLPWLDWHDTQIDCLRVDRAEPSQPFGRKPDEAVTVACANGTLCWPTKLSLLPDLGDQVLNALEPPPQAPHADPGAAAGEAGTTPAQGAGQVAVPVVGAPPWLR